MGWLIGILIVLYVVYSISHFFIQAIVNVLSPEEASGTQGQQQIDSIEQELYALQSKLDDLSFRYDELEHDNALLKIDNDYVSELYSFLMILNMTFIVNMT